MKALSDVVGQFPFARHLLKLNNEVARHGLSASVISESECGSPEYPSSRLDIEILDQSDGLILSMEYYIGEYEAEVSDHNSEDILNIKSDQPSVGAPILTTLFESKWEETIIDHSIVTLILERLLTDGPILSVFLSWYCKLGVGFRRSSGFYYYSAPEGYGGKPMMRVNKDRKAARTKKNNLEFISLKGFQMSFGSGESGHSLILETGSGFLNENDDILVCSGSSSTGPIGVKYLGDKLQFSMIAMNQLASAYTDHEKTIKFWTRLFLPGHSVIRTVGLKCTLIGREEINIACDGSSIDWDSMTVLAKELALTDTELLMNT